MRSYLIHAVAAAAVLLLLTLSGVTGEERRPPEQAGKNKAGEAAAAPVRVITLSVGETTRLQASSKKPIKTVVNEKPEVAWVQPVANDPTTVLVTGVAPGRTRITLTTADGDKEVWESGKPPAKP
jgi:Pilus formation protein N terminal region